MPFFSKLGGATSDQPDILNPIRAELRTASPEERFRILCDRLREHVASVMKLAPAKVDLDQPLLTMGIDSLMAVELKSRVEREIGIAIPLLQLIKGPSLSELAHSLLNSLGGQAVPVSDNRPNGSTPEERGSGKSLLLSLLSVSDTQSRSIHESEKDGASDCRP